MVCIWSANLKSVWGVFSVQLIVENMHRWALEWLRPQLNYSLTSIKKSFSAERHAIVAENRNDTAIRGREQVPIGGLTSADEDLIFSSTSWDMDSQSSVIDFDEGESHLDMHSTPPTSPIDGETGFATPTHQSRSSGQGIAAETRSIPPGPVHAAGDETWNSSPVPKMSASAKRYAEKTSSDVRALPQQRQATPSKVAASSKGLHHRHSGGAEVTDQAPAFNRSDTPVKALSAATEAGNPDDSPESISSPALSSENGPTTHDSDAYGVPGRSKRPSAARFMSDGAKKFKERGEAFFGDMRDRLNEHNDVSYPNLKALMAQEASSQRQSASGVACSPTNMTDSPAHTPLQGVPEDEHDDDTSSTQPSISSKNSWYHRRSSSKILQRTPSKPQTDASSEISATSSQLQTLTERARQGIDFVKGKAEIAAESLESAARDRGHHGTADNVQRLAAWYLNAAKERSGADRQDEGPVEVNDVNGDRGSQESSRHR